jgi:hypothetical protein
MARSGSNRGLLRPDFAGWETSQQQTRGCDAIAHLKFTGVDAAVAIPYSPAFDSARNRSGRPQPFPGQQAAEAGAPLAWRIEGDRFTRPQAAIGHGEVLLYSLASFDPAAWLEKPRKE